MQAFCLVSPDPVSSPILETYLGFSLNQAEVFTLDLPTVGIDDIRDLIRFLTTRPLKAYKVILIPHAETLTLPAQQALLKTLEEPPLYARLILITPTLTKLLPTILSRTQIYYLTHTKTVEAPDSEMIKFFKDLMENSVPGRVKLCQKFTTKEKVELLLHHGFLYYQGLLPQNPNVVTVLKLLTQSDRYLKANVSPIQVVEHLALHFPFA